MLSTKFTVLRLFAFLLFTLISGQLYAQVGMGFGAEDLPTLQSDDLSDAQLRMFVNRAEQEGISIDEAFQMARAQGLRASVATQLRNRIQTLGPATEQDIESSSVNPSELELVFTRPERVESEEMKRTFGSQIFRQQATEFIPSQNIPTPLSYTLGPGDELVIQIWGDQTNSYRPVVAPEGTIIIDNLGPVQVSGLTIAEVTERIVNNLEQIYSGLRSQNGEQSTFASVTINRLRTIQVSIIGEAVNPGDYAIPSFSTVYNALYRSGGPDENGTYRTIRVIRENEVVAELDLYSFLVEGIQEGNIQLRDGDVIQIPPYKNRVEVFGETKRNDLYFEVQEGETLSDLIRFAGYFTDKAYVRQLRVHRNTPTERRIISVDNHEIDQFTIQGGDVLYVDEILDRFENRVSISGAVWRNGEFELKDGMTLSDLIAEADGLRPDAFVSRGLINRMQNDYSLEQIAFDLSELLENPESHDIELKREDHIIIRSIHEMRDEQVVHIEGAIRSPGDYNHRSQMTLEDLILQADGFSDAALEARIDISRRIIGDDSLEERGDELAEIFTFDVTRDLELREEDKLFQLEPFDRVFIHRRPDYQPQRTVTIEGEVTYPGTYTIQHRNERISDLISRAGGLTNEAYVPGSRLVRQHTAIDRPEITLDFLSEEEVVNEENLDFMTENERRLLERREEDRQIIEQLEKELDDSQEEELTIEQMRAKLNREGLRVEEEDSLNQLGEVQRRLNERRIGIDLADVLSNPGSEEDLYLRDGDILRVPQELQTVAISGAVMQDVEVRYQAGRNLKYYIDRAGGFTENAREKRIYIVYANGDVDRRKRYLFGLIKSSPPIEPGAQIIIPAKPPRSGMNTGELVSISAAIVGMTTSLIIALDRVAR